jgi:hypothetical protein
MTYNFHTSTVIVNLGKATMIMFQFQQRQTSMTSHKFEIAAMKYR